MLAITKMSGTPPVKEIVLKSPGAQLPLHAPSYVRLRIGFWSLGILLALFEAWTNRYFVTTDAIAYMDMSDAVLPGQNWHRLINGVWSPLYPALLGLCRRIFGPSAAQEIAFDHFLNVPIFLFAFAAFEFLLRSVERELIGPSSRNRVLLPRWAFLTLGYSLFIWASISEITLQSLRPDMLMSAFLYLAVALAVRMRGHRSSLGSFLGLGVVMGIGFLVKAPMLPIAMLILAVGVLVVEDSWPAIPKAVCAALLLLLIGSLYFLPLSRSLGHFTLGESARFNYILYVDHARPGLYLTNSGTAAGVPLHRARQIFAEPACYEFSMGLSVTHPLRFDPSYWTQGLRPVFSLRSQLSALAANLPVFKTILIRLAGMIVGFLILCYFHGARATLIRDLFEGWPLWLVGAAGVLMYAPLHVEARYVGAFFVLFWLGLVVGLGRWRRDARVIAGIVVGIAVSLMIPTARAAYLPRVFRWNPRSNINAEVAQALPRFGVQPGDPVARISTAGDLGWARTARVTIIAEVDYESGARAFWKSDPSLQSGVLKALRQTGAKSVVAHVWNDVTAPGWYRVGRTHYWIYPFTITGSGHLISASP